MGGKETLATSGANPSDFVFPKLQSLFATQRTRPRPRAEGRCYCDGKPLLEFDLRVWKVNVCTNPRICVSKFVPLTLPEEALIKVLAPPNSEYPRRKPPVRVHTKPYARARLATCSG